MERTESKIVQVAPQNENEVLQQMQTFGWNLHGRQEMRYDGNSVTKPDLFSGFGDYVSYTTITQIHHYTKLHFTRSLETPNLDKIHILENEYFNMSYPELPELPKLFPVGAWLWIILFLVYGIGLVIWGLYYFLSYAPKKKYYEQEVIRIEQEVIRINRRADEIEAEIIDLLR